jgi:hypothetical protein
MSKTYKDQFTPAELDTDFSFDGLNMRDKGHLTEHLAPFGWNVPPQSGASAERIWWVNHFIERAKLAYWCQY